MKIRFVRILVLIFGIMLVGCAGGKQAKAPVLSPTKLEKVESTSLYIVMEDNRLTAEIVRSNVASGAYMFGFVGGAIAGAVDAAIESKRQNDADEFISPLHGYLSSYDFIDLLRSELMPRLSEIENLHITNTKVLTKFKRKDLKKLLDESNTNSAIIIDARVALIPNFRALKITTKAKMYIDGYGGGRQLFATEAIHLSELTDESEREDILFYWSKDNGEQLKADIQAGFKGVSHDLELRFGGGIQLSEDKQQEAGV